MAKKTLKAAPKKAAAKKTPDEKKPSVKKKKNSAGSDPNEIDQEAHIASCMAGVNITAQGEPFDDRKRK